MSRTLACLGLVAVLFLGACTTDVSSPGDPKNGEALFFGAAGCALCHSLNPGEVLTGPSFAGVAGRGAKTIRDPEYAGLATSVEEYLRESILEPDAFAVVGFSHGIMPDIFTDLAPQELEDLVTFLANLE